ncbi:hypothetical protein [Marivita sp.]|uniref:hypothetical protein n=1 Tax=Marivita sp. TaxID=2003365 RepID=UPI0025C27957|nr:hypothetical protein [Marivita sp.]HKL06610.1 hypothetical protein [Roseovarius sp.]
MSDSFQYYREEFYNDYQSALSHYSGGPGLTPSKEEAFRYYEHFATHGENKQYFGRVVKSQHGVGGFTHQKYKEFEPKGQAFNPGSSADSQGKEHNGMMFHDDQFKYAWLKKHGWTALLNDVWLIANAHRKKLFEPVSAINDLKIYTGDEFIVSVFGRELCGLLMSGYIRPNKGAFTATHGEGDHSARRLSLTHYAKTMNAMQKAGQSEFQKFFGKYNVFDK